ncbi:MAG: hypothetical protein JO080_10975 [Mucilaginibacter sp.]|nr:hypothetical protein [Mucilaginibacter sp.]
MTLSDVSLIGKKILVGIIVTIIPFVIIVGGLWLTQHILTAHDAQKSSAQTTLKSENHENRKSN